MELTSNRRIVATLLAFGLAAGALVGGSQTAGASPAAAATTAAACTDGGETADNFVAYNMYVELRRSAKCGGTAWFRINYNGGGIQGNGEVTLQLKSRTGTVSSVYTKDVLSASPSWVSPYYTGYSQARLVYKNKSGGVANRTGGWKSIYQEAR
ncbi:MULTISPECIES: hypothetical protein [unclassified Curtobacterium]|uniref:hypothetical protein n=1 Tax=unclassified Curtobacterium TaxID=257496 RepID=UPI000DA8FE4B|nr:MULTISPECIES: hypothetical protein [unclassified Curtobacterium]PZF09859.1 hypothetical protein DEI98_10910 [Curtobacterium sp. MCLR17_034]WIB34055.1 hypothetical protein DEJ20_06210 [Curtobacterium sp. MCSS17_005]WIB43851.1 hypothetical protein DEJ11_05915 [Curtobacterium sp. MCLR17_058]WIE80196.1 hypothetical protein DEJ19_006400 [Curtobacterium sp. MCSS17_016]